MKSLNSLVRFGAFLTGCGFATLVHAGSNESFRTDINPALRYYQAFALAPQLEPADHQYLYVKEWRGKELDSRVQELIAGYDNVFRLCRRAAQATAPCDWGIDLTEGPEALLPGLAKAKNIAQLSRFRAMWHLQNGRADDARNDLLAAFALAHQTSRDGTLIAALVQFAMENIVTSAVAENYYRLPPETLKQIVEGFDTAPRRGTVLDCVSTEHYGFAGWFLPRIEKIQQDNSSNPTAALESVKALLERTMQSPESPDPQLVPGILQAAGGTVDGVLKLFHDLDPFYERVSQLMTLPCSEFEPAMASFNADLEKAGNPLSAEFLKGFEKSRVKEFAIMIRAAMMQAALAYRLEGEEGFRRVKDPCGNGPFGFERFTFNGVDRGFKVTSPYKSRGFQEVLIFVEKPGPAFQVDAKEAGKALGE